MPRTMKLTLDDIAMGICNCAENARALTKDARRMYSRRRYSTATALAISAFEEYGKIIPLAILSVAVRFGLEIDWNTFWKSYSVHKVKQGLGSFLGIGLFGKEAVELALKTLIFEADLEELRRRCLYADGEKASWRQPKMIDRKYAVRLLDAVESLTEELWSQYNLRRYKRVLQELEEIQIPVVVEHQPWLPNWMEAGNEFSRILRKVNIAYSKELK